MDPRGRVGNGRLGSLDRLVLGSGRGGLALLDDDLIAALFKGGDLLRDIVFGNDEVFRPEAVDVVSLAIGDGNIELDKNYVHAKARGLVLRGGPRDSGDHEKESSVYIEPHERSD